MIDTKIRTLLTLVNVGSYTRAAEELHLTQPAVSNHIRQRSTNVGNGLFSKTRWIPRW